ncbi:MAG: cytochrome c [Crocinitomicaceae bacterium]|nr:cytochrome c [Crocinitomicaceae bacterium]
MKGLVLIILSIFIGILYAFELDYQEVDSSGLSGKKVYAILVETGVTPPAYYIESVDSAKARQGEDLLTIGYTRINNANSKKISRHFVCINCHNLVPETNHPESADPEIRLEYMMKNKLPFLPASTLYGVVNRTSYFNGDYVKKYGPRAEEAKNDLRKAIQVCAEISSEGRILETWETEAILHYLNVIQLRIGDLSLTKEEMKILNSEDKDSKRKLLESKYLSKESATFGYPLASNVRELGKKGDPKKGKYIFKFGCMHCHNPEGITIFTLEDDQFNRNFLKNKMKKTNNRSIYEITRTGTQPKKLKKTYMPMYTYERLSDQQLEDLAAYLNSKPD